MISPVLADMFVKSVTSSSLINETGKTATDSAFQQIFDSSLKNSASTSQESDNTGSTSSTSGAGNEPEIVTCKYECGTGDTGSVKSDSDNYQANDTTSAATHETEVQEEPSAKVEKLKTEDPQSYDSLVANLDNMTVGDLLSALGIDTQGLNLSNYGLSLESPVPESIKNSLLSGDSAAINDAFASIGVGGMATASALSTLGSAQTGTVISVDVSNSLASTSSNSTTQVDAVSASGANSSSSQISGVGDSSSNSGSQTSMTGSDNGSISASSANASAAVSTTGGANSSAANSTVASAADTSTASTLAQSQAAATGQTDSKPVVTVQNLTNETAANAINSQTTKTGEAQAQSNARPASAVRLASDRAILEQIVDKARVIVRPNGSSNMVIRLDPPSLGKLDMRIDVKDGSVRASIVTDSKEVKSAIESNMDSLKNSLHASGLKVDEISVSVGGDQGFKFKNDGLAQQTGDQGYGEKRGGVTGQSANDTETTQEDASARRAAAYRHSGVLDVVA